MKSGQIAALTALLSVGAQAAPRLGHQHGLKHAAFHHKRDVVWVTTYEVETVTVIRSVYPDGSEVGATTLPAAAPTYPAPVTPITSSAAAPTLPSPSETGATYPAPVQSTSAAAPAPVTTSAYVPPPATTSAYAPPPVTTSAYVPPPATTVAPASSAAPAPAPSSSAPASGGYGGGFPFSGDATHWDPSLGACGMTNSSSEDVVAISQDLYDQHLDPKDPANPNLDLACGQMVNIKGLDGQTYPAMVVDRCTGCAMHDLDMSITLFNKVTNNGDGRVHNIAWGSTFAF